MKKLVSDSIISLLERGPVAKGEVLRRVQEASGVTQQAVYKEIGHLTSSGKILSHQGALSLNLLYITKEYDRWSAVLNNYDSSQSLKNHFLDLREGESLTLKFKTLNDLDAYWVHAFVILYKNDRSRRPSFSVIPHDWFSYGRKETDSFWVKSQTDRIRVIITGSTKLDKEIAAKRRRAGHKINVAVNPLKQDNRTYYTLINGYVFKVTIDPKIQKLLSDFAAETKSAECIDDEKIREITGSRCSCVMKILRNEKKFEAMSAKCGKYFSA